MNLVKSLLGLLTKRERPLHVGEVMNVWKIMVAFEEGHAMIMGLVNHTADSELKRFTESFLADFEEPWMRRVKLFMQGHGIPLPPAGTDKAKANEADVPGGAKFSDSEIAAVLAAKVMSGTSVVQQALLECLHYDLAALLMELEVAAYRQGFVLRELMERRGWFKQPPLWHASKVTE